MTDSSHYAIRGGVQGRERLRTLSRVMHGCTGSLLDRLNLRDGMVCLDVGCGGGDTTLEIARRVAPHGTAVGADIDDTKLALAREKAQQVIEGPLAGRLCGKPASRHSHGRSRFTRWPQSRSTPSGVNTGVEASSPHQPA